VNMVVDVGNQRIETGAFGGLAFGEGDVVKVGVT
jgi:hypothetical protein